MSYLDQVEMLRQRGLQIVDPVAAADFLSHLNYYRFSGYCLAFEVSRHRFASGCTFEDIQAAYEFDRILRDLIAEALEPIELDLRTNLAHHLGKQYGAFGHADANNFWRGFNHPEWLDKLHHEAQRSSDLFVRHFKMKYHEFPDLPVWVVMEIASFGSLSKMFSGMLNHDQKSIAMRYGWQAHFLAKTIHHLAYVRNLCAHHARLWDREWSVSPKLPAARHWQSPLISTGKRLFATLAILCDLLKGCPTQQRFADQWRRSVAAHLASYPTKAINPLDRMGLTANWHDHPCWT